MNKLLNRNMLAGLLFSMFWASASVAAKYGLHSAEPLVLFNIRFLFAGLVMLIYTYGIQHSPMPSGKEWKQLCIFGAFNSALYLGIFILAIQYVAAGITVLAVALNPLLISVMSAMLTKRKISPLEWLSIILGVVGVCIAAYPLLQTSHVSFTGLILLGMSMMAYSFGSVYYSSVHWNLPQIAINAWQVFISAFLIFPFTIWLHSQPNHFDLTFWLSLLWLVFPVSILAVQLWLALLKSDAVQASLWLYLCPIFGFVYATLLLGEPFTIYTAGGTMLVIAALYLGQKKAIKPLK